MGITTRTTRRFTLHTTADAASIRRDLADIPDEAQLMSVDLDDVDAWDGTVIARRAELHFVIEGD